MNRFLRSILPPLIPFVLITLGTEMLVRAGWVRAYLVPAPSSVIRSIGDNWRELLQAMLSTAMASLIGFAISSSLGIAIAIALATSGWIQRAFYPYAVFFQTVPIIAIAPLLVIWFGLDMDAVVASSFIVSVFPVIANTLAGLLSTEPALKDMFRLYGAGTLATLLKLRLPFALPNIFTGLRIAAGLSVIGTIVGEFITGGGLGGLIEIARAQQRVEKVFAVLLLSSVLGIALFGGINLLSRLSLRHWHASEGER
jgi:NitT/TauT family transport system permease protein